MDTPHGGPTRAATRRRGETEFYRTNKFIGTRDYLGDYASFPMIARGSGVTNKHNITLCKTTEGVLPLASQSKLVQVLTSPASPKLFGEVLNFAVPARAIGVEISFGEGVYWGIMRMLMQGEQGRRG